MKRSVRPFRASSSFFFLALVTAGAALAARSACGCTLSGFTIYDGLDADRKATAGHKVTFFLRFEGTDAKVGTIKVLYGDGTGEDIGPRNLERTFGQSDAHMKFDHTYTRPGVFDASLRGGSVQNQPCTFNPLFGLGLVVDGKPALRVTVLENPLKSKAKMPTATPQPAFETKKNFSVPPTAVPPAKSLGATQTVGKEKGNTAFALAPGQITRASLSTTPLGKVLKVEGSGNCGFKAVEDVDGRMVKTYDYKGTFPATIQLLNSQPGLHGLVIEGDRSAETCGGTVRTSFQVGKPQ
jgi:hypothetical protein